MPKLKTVAVVGATGAVGQTMLAVLEERNFPVGELRPFASERSQGKTVRFKGNEIPVRPISPGCFKGVDYALFSAGGAVSKEVAPQAVREGAIVIDNTAAFRYEPDIPLVVPEVNRHAIKKHQGLIANPNCSTIQMLVALKPLHDAARLTRIIVSTYQSVSGAGNRAIREMLDSTRAALDGKPFANEIFAHPIAFNVIPQIDVFLDNGFTKEEMKMVWETHKIMEAPEIGVTATCVRVPVRYGHSEAIYAEFERALSVEEARTLWAKAPGVKVIDDPAQKLYPLAIHAAGADATYVGRLRADLANPKALNFWCVSDNLRKGAATNAVQIAECLAEGD